jgi:hypothetical protein
MAADLPLASHLATDIRCMGHRHLNACSDTVPICLWLVARHPAAVDEALRQAVHAEGDLDATTAIIGGNLDCWQGRCHVPDTLAPQSEPNQFDVDRVSEHESAGNGCYFIHKRRALHRRHGRLSGIRLRCSQRPGALVFTLV